MFQFEVLRVRKNVRQIELDMKWSQLSKCTEHVRYICASHLSLKKERLNLRALVKRSQYIQ